MCTDSFRQAEFALLIRMLCVFEFVRTSAIALRGNSIAFTTSARPYEVLTILKGARIFVSNRRWRFVGGSGT